MLNVTGNGYGTTKKIDTPKRKIGVLTRLGGVNIQVAGTRVFDVLIQYACQHAMQAAKASSTGRRAFGL